LSMGSWSSRIEGRPFLASPTSPGRTSSLVMTPQFCGTYRG
jgi:hypothetical protein